MTTTPEQRQRLTDRLPSTHTPLKEGRHDTTEQVVRALRVENERLRAALHDVTGACGPACCSDCDAYYVAKKALDGAKETP